MCQAAATPIHISILLLILVIIRSLIVVAHPQCRVLSLQTTYGVVNMYVTMPRWSLNVIQSISVSAHVMPNTVSTEIPADFVAELLMNIRITVIPANAPAKAHEANASLVSSRRIFELSLSCSCNIFAVLAECMNWCYLTLLYPQIPQSPGCS